MARFLSALLLTSIASAAVGLGTYVGLTHVGGRSGGAGAWQGIVIDGTPVHSSAEAREVALSKSRASLGRRVRVKVEGTAEVVREGTLGELGVVAELDRVVVRAEQHAQAADFTTRVLSRVVVPPPIDIPLTYAVDSDKALAWLVPTKEERDVAPVSAKLDLEHHTVVPELAGKYIDAFGSMKALGELAARAPAGNGDGATLELTLPTASFAPRVSSDFVKKLNISTVLGEYETHFSRGGDQARRGANIDRASAKLDGLILAPGELVSFNTIVGERSEANGFQRSWEIFKGEMVEGVGGGTCQVASTFHAASVFGGIDILERLPHSRPSAYIPMGLDSTVVYPSVDLKLKNPHPFPVVVHAKTVGNTLKVEILGREKPVHVHFGRDVVATIPYSRKLVEEPSLSGKKVVHKQHGIRGYRIRRTRDITYADGTHRVETSTDFYPPTADIYQVPVGFDESLLPAIPGEKDEPTVAKADAPSDLEIVEGKGAHAPTAMQRAPSGSLRASQ